MDARKQRVRTLERKPDNVKKTMKKGLWVDDKANECIEEMDLGSANTMAKSIVHLNRPDGSAVNESSGEESMFG
jgi:hypothetical protein